MANTPDNVSRTRGERVEMDTITSAPAEVVNERRSAPIESVQYNREVRQTTTQPAVSQVMNLPADRVRWGPIWAGLFTALFVLLVLGLLGIAIGLTTVNTTAVAAGQPNSNAGQYSAIWAGISAIIAFLIGGYVAGRTAAVHERGWAALNGALVFLLALPFILYLASQGLGAIVANAGSIASNLGINLGAIGSAAHSPTTGQVQQAASAVKTAAWGTLIGLVVGLLAGAIGGILGTRAHPSRDELGGLARR